MSIPIIRRGTKLRDFLKVRVGDFSILGHPTRGQCVAVYARAALGTAAGYNSANDIARAVVKAGKRHRGKAPIGAAHMWMSSAFGHIAANYNTADTHVICNDYRNGGAINVVPRSVYDSLYYVGWCYPEDIPGWGPVAAGANGSTTPATPTVKPVVHVSRVQPVTDNPTAERNNSKSEVLTLQKALHAEPKIRLDYSSGPGIMGPRTEAAYQEWQVLLGFSKANGDADGAPGLTSLTELGKRHGFRAAA